MGSGALSAGPPGPPTPHKKMKKRKELNALIGLSGDNGRKKPKKGSGHRLLRTEPPASDSDTNTEDDEFGAAGDRRVRCVRELMFHCCQVCYPLCAFIVVAACVVTCAGLVWMQVTLKENIDALKEQFKAMESSQKNSFQEIPKINEDLLVKQKRLDDLVSGELGLSKLWTNITEMNKQIALLSGAVTQLKANLKSASDLINLPKTMEELQKSVATLGSTLTSVHHDVETLQTAAEEQRQKVETLQKDLENVTAKFSSAAAWDIGTHDLTQVQNSLAMMNATVLLYESQNDGRLLHIDSMVSDISQRVSLLEGNVRKENLSVRAVENSTDVTVHHPYNSSSTDPSKRLEAGMSPASGIQEQLQLIHALTRSPDSDMEGRTDGADTLTSRPSFTKVYPRSLRRKRRRGVFLPGIITQRDLDRVVRASGNELGSDPPEHSSHEEYDEANVGV